MKEVAMKEVHLSPDQLVEAMFNYCRDKALVVVGDESVRIIAHTQSGTVSATCSISEARVPDLKRILELRTKQRDELWHLLDNIDTLDDACRENDSAFRELSRKHSKRRFEIYNPEADR